MGAKLVRPVVEAHDAHKYLTGAQLDECKSLFQVISRSQDYKNVSIKKTVFMATLLDPVLGAFVPKVKERVFHLLDYNGQGSIGYDEFLCYYVVFGSGQRELKRRFTFNMFDISATQKISKKEFQKMALAFMKRPPNDKSMKTEREQKQIDEMTKQVVAPLADIYSSMAIGQFDRKKEKTLSWIDFGMFLEDDDYCLRFISSIKMPPTTNVQSGNSI